MKWRLAIFGGFLTTIILPVFPFSTAKADTVTTSNNVLISEVKLGGDSYSQGTDQPKDPQEFITLFNQGSSEVNLDGWVLEYAKTTFDKTYCSASSWSDHSVSSSASATVLTGTIQPGKVSTPIARSLTDNTAGSLRLIDTSNKDNPAAQDLVGWGTNAPCMETMAAATPSNGKSLKRYVACDNNYPIDTGDNSKDFASSQPPSPGALGNPYLTNCDAPPGNPNQPQPQTCEGVVISELLPNPSGLDTNNEFIELYNPTAALISLQGCSLQTTGNNKVYNFGNVSLQPGEYHAFYDSETGLTLPNSAGGTAWLLSPNTELQAIVYPANMGDDVSWSLVNSIWKPTYQPTPNAANVLVASKSCPEGEERNSDAGYCRATAVLSTSTLSVCKAGEVRNKATNRCHSVETSSSGSTLAQCKAGQVRNPQTNRCKAVATTASATLKPCAAGQERNPATNRCKKSTSSSGKTLGLATVKDSVSGSIAKNPHWWLAGFTVLGATGYGVYEWRQEVMLFLGRLRNKLPI